MEISDIYNMSNEPVKVTPLSLTESMTTIQE